MPLSGDISTALQLLEHIQHTIHASEDVKLEAQTSNDLNLLISVLENPILRGIVTIQDSLCELNQQLQHHPSILPADFEFSPSGELVLSLPPSPPSSADIYDVGSTNSRSGVGTGSGGLGVGFEFEDQRVPVAALSNSSSSGENVSSPQTRVGQVSSARGVAKRGAGTHFLQLPGGREGSGDDEEEEEDDGITVGGIPQPPITTTAYAMEFQKAIGAASQGRDVHTIKLFKPEGSSLGFSVVGLRSEEKGELGIFVQEIQPTGIAGRDGRLQEGDQILAIDGQPLDSNISHHQAISILQKARGLVELVVARNAAAPSSESSVPIQSHLPTSTPPVQSSTTPASASSISSILSVGSQAPPLPPPRSPTPTATSTQVPIERSPSAVSDTSKPSSDMVLNTEWAQVEVIDLLNDGSGLGFGIIGGRSTGVVVKTILPTGVADRDGRLQSGDHILQIGDVNLRGMGSEQVAAVLRQSGSHVRLVVARPVEPTSPDYQALGSHAPIVPTKILGDPEELDRQLLQNGYDADAAFSGPPPPLPIPINQLATSTSSGLLPQGGLDAAGLPYDYTFTTFRPPHNNVVPRKVTSRPDNAPPPPPSTSPPGSPETCPPPPPFSSDPFPVSEFESDPFPAFPSDPFVPAANAPDPFGPQPKNAPSNTPDPFAPQCPKVSDPFAASDPFPSAPADMCSSFPSENEPDPFFSDKTNFDDPFNSKPPSVPDEFDLKRTSVTDLFEPKSGIDPFDSRRTSVDSFNSKCVSNIDQSDSKPLSDVDMFDSKPASIVDQSDSKPPSVVDPFESKRPSIVDQCDSHPPSVVDPFDSKRPSIVDQCDFQPPFAVDPFHSKHPSIVDQFDSKPPSVVDPFDSKRPSLTDSFDFKLPEYSVSKPANMPISDPNNFSTVSEPSYNAQEINFPSSPPTIRPPPRPRRRSSAASVQLKESPLFDPNASTLPSKSPLAPAQENSARPPQPNVPPPPLDSPPSAPLPLKRIPADPNLADLPPLAPRHNPIIRSVKFDPASVEPSASVLGVTPVQQSEPSAKQLDPVLSTLVYHAPRPFSLQSQGPIVGDTVGIVTASSLNALEPLPEMEKFEVELRKDAHGLGITIAGYVCEKEELSGIFVKSISEGSAADLCGRIQVNDRIVEVDGRSLQGYTNHGAVEVLRGTGRTVRLCLERYLRGPKYEQLQQAIANSELLQGRQGLQQQIGIQRQPLTTGMPSVPVPSGNSITSIGILPPPTPSSPSATSLPHCPLSSTDGEEETTEIEPEGESHTTIDSAVLLEGLGGLGEEGIVDEDDEIGGRSTMEALNMDVDIERLINTCYEGELDSAVEAAVRAKWSKIMGPDCEIVVAQLSKFGEGGGLGISLEGTVDVEGGREVRPHHYIRSILPEGPVGRNGKLRSGDELLEVNGIRLLGLNHVEVVANLKELPVHVRMVCARKAPDAQPQHRLLIDTAQDRAAFAARSILGGSLQNLLPTTDRLVKAKSDGSLASSSTATATISSAAHTPGASHAPTTPTFSSPSSSSAPGSSSGPSGDVGAGDISLGLGVGGGLSAKMRSRSLEPLTGLAMWSSEPQVIELVKGERGLGFSILDYQDPMNPSETVIVIRSLVPGGVAQTDGRLVPGDRLLAVNEARLENASLDRAVQALKGAPRGVVRIAVAKPLPLLPTSTSSTAEEENREAEQNALYRQQEEGSAACGEEKDVSVEGEEKEEVVEEEEELGEVGGEDAEVTEPEEEGESLGTTTLDEHSLLTTPSPSTESASAENLHEQKPIVRPPSTSERILSPGEDEEEESLEEEEEEEVDSGEGEGSEEEEEEVEVEELEEKGEEDDETSRLPASLELEIKIRKGADPLGLVLETGAVGIGAGVEGPQSLGAWVGCDGALVKEVTAGGAVARDGRIAPGDLILSVNHESLRRVGSAQAKTILHRAQLLSTDIAIRYIPGKAVKAYQESLAQQGSSVIGVTAGLQKRPIVPLKLVSPSSPFGQGEAFKLSPSKQEKEILIGAQESPLDEGGGKELLEREAEIVATVLAETPKSVSEFEEGDGFVPSPPLQFRLTPGEELTPFEKPTFPEILQDVKTPEETTMTVTKISQGHSSSSVDKAGGSGAGYYDGAAGGGKQSSVLLAKHWGPERLVEVLREPNCSLGISIVGGKVDLYNAGPDSGSAISGIFIKNVIPHSPAGRTGELKTGDRILEVDGIDVRHASHERAVEVIRGSGNPVTFLVQSLIQWNDSGEDQRNGATSASSFHSSSSWASTSSSSAPSAGMRRQSSKMRAPAPPPLARTPSPEVIQPGLNNESQMMNHDMQRKASVKEEKAPPPKKTTTYSSSEEESDDEDDKRDQEGRILTKKGAEIYRSSAGAVKRTREEVEADPEEEDDYGYTMNKIHKRYAPMKTGGVDVVVATLERGSWGLGISLAGHRDRTKMAVFVAGMNPNGSAAKDGTLQVGDEILEVNGIVLHGRCHLNASATIKGLAGPVFKVIVLRREEGVKELAVKPITQFPVSLDDESPEDRFANFKGLRTVTIKKGPQGLGIMIIEGKHAEVGQGIFISDIQEGSAAEQAGLIVGDMILQVNKDVILGSNYDSTASLLKKTEGVVTIIVCNPNKAKEEEKAKEGGKKEEEKPKLLTKPMSGTTPTKTSPLSSFNLASIIKSSHSTQRASSCVSHGSQIIPDHPHSSKKHSQSAPTKNNVPRAMTNKSSAASSKNPPRPTLLTTPNSTHPTKRQPSPPAITHGPSKSPGTTPEPTEAPPEPPADPATCEIKPGRETTVEINKDNVGLGLSIVGGSDTLLAVIIIHEVYSDGAAAKDGRLKPGDQILEVNGVDFRNITHAKALAALRQTPAKVKMTVYRDEAAASGGKEEDLLDIMEVELAKKAGKGLGLSIVGRKNGVGVFISDVVKGGAAEADGRLMKGDQIIAVNGQDLKGATQEEAAAVLKTATGRVTIKLGRLRPRKGAAPEKTSSSLLRDSASPETSPILPASPPTIITPSPSAAMGPPLRTRTIRLERGPDGLGFSIVGGHGSPHGDLPIYVKTVFERGSASKGGLGEDNRLHRGDQILAVDGVSLDGRTHQEAVALLKGTRKRGSVTLTIAR